MKICYTIGLCFLQSQLAEPFTYQHITDIQMSHGICTFKNNSERYKYYVFGSSCTGASDYTLATTSEQRGRSEKVRGSGKLKNEGKRVNDLIFLP
jgi:hypothetical protein